MSKDLETINKSLDNICQKLLELCKIMGIEFSQNARRNEVWLDKYHYLIKH